MSGSGDLTSIAVVGAGPCGLGVGIAARRHGLPCILYDRACVASSIARYPTFMQFFSTAERLEIGGVPFITARDKPTRREAIRYYQRLAREFQLDVRQYEEVVGIERTESGFRLRSRRFSGRTREVTSESVVIATGYFDHPNRLAVPGSDLPKLRYGYAEAHPYYDQDVVVVGGGNSAVDAALALHRWGARVTIVHFAEDLDSGVKPWVLPDMKGRLRNDEIAARFSTRIAAITPDTVVLRSEASGQTEEIPNDWVLAMTGYTPDPVLLRSLGVRFDDATGIPRHDASTMMTDVERVFIAGVLAAGNDANKVFIENGRDHGERIVRFLAGATGAD